MKMPIRKKHVTYLLIFVLGWFAGTFFATVNLMGNGKRHGVAYNFSSITSQNWLPTLGANSNPGTLITKTKEVVKPNRSVPVTRRLPSFPAVFSNETDEEALVILDWPVDDKLFTAENYLALETLLVNHPDSRFRLNCTTHIFSL
jgi:hypothetical protein